MPDRSTTPAPRRQTRVDPRALRMGIVGALVVAAILAATYLIPTPSVSLVRSWGDSLGPSFVWLFFIAYAVVTIAPIPRSTFTILAGVFFGPVVGFVGSMIASAVAAIAAFLLARHLGRARVQPYLGKPVVAAIEYRLTHRGWLAVGSLRLIAACPFSVTNYCAALSSVRLLPYTVASVIGMAPGTAAVVFLGDALTGTRSPLSLMLTGLLFAVGLTGLLLDARLPLPPTPETADEGETSKDENLIVADQAEELDVNPPRSGTTSRENA